MPFGVIGRIIGSAAVAGSIGKAATEAARKKKTSSKSSSSAGSSSTRTSALERAAGKSSSATTSGAPYDKYVRGMGKEGYVAEIRDKLSKGMELKDFDDPNAAAAFIQSHPEYEFWRSWPGSGGATTSSGVTVQQGAQPPKTQQPPITQPELPPWLTEPPPWYDWTPPEIPTPSTPSPPPPTTITGPPQVEVPAGEEVVPPIAQTAEFLAKGPGGFVHRTAAPATMAIRGVPNVDELYDLYVDITGEENPQLKEYFASPQFQSILSGNVPMWMSSDPVWRLYLTRLGLLGSGETNVQRMRALRRRLGGTDEEEKEGR